MEDDFVLVSPQNINSLINNSNKHNISLVENIINSIDVSNNIVVEPESQIVDKPEIDIVVEHDAQIVVEPDTQIVVEPDTQIVVEHDTQIVVEQDIDILPETNNNIIIETPNEIFDYRNNQLNHYYVDHMLDSPNEEVLVNVDDSINYDYLYDYNPYKYIDTENEELLNQLRNDMNYIDSYVIDLENQLPDNNKSNDQYTQTEEEPSFFDTICDYIGITILVDKITSSMPSKEELRNKLRSSSIYKLFDFLF